MIGYVAKMMPLLALSDFLEGFQCVLSGTVRGRGWQNLCANINLGAYYVVAVPCAVLFAFGLRIGGMEFETGGSSTRCGEEGSWSSDTPKHSLRALNWTRDGYVLFLARPHGSRNSEDGSKRRADTA
ncbi:hypothetical protein RJ640_028562 [Escallonia rubra]|uniref:Uncharacterized protein n=1 Tax=Escallonia rubra TaxID=112253 RepID=A0AA88QII9_9ASTE|nr:hypothetical protein RJ640_028562 [Escallonia rubra]